MILPLRTPARPRTALTLALVLASATFAAPATVMAQDKIMATVDGKKITEADLKLAEFEIGGDLGNLPPATRRRVLVEYMIENQLFADAAEANKLSTGKEYEDRLSYWRRRALRDTFFDKNVKGDVGEGVAKAFYDDQIKGMKPEEEVQVTAAMEEDHDRACAAAFSGVIKSCRDGASRARYLDVADNG